MTVQPTYRADIPRNVRDEVRVIIEPAHVRFMLDVRVWEDARFGQVCTRVPTKQGVTLDPRKLPDLIAALEGARSEAIRLGLLEVVGEERDAPHFSPFASAAEDASAMNARNTGPAGVSGPPTPQSTQQTEGENVRR